MSDELRTVFVWDTQSPEAGGEKIAKAWDKAADSAKENSAKIGRAQRDAGKDSQAGSKGGEDDTLRTDARALKRRAQAQQEISKFERETSDRRKTSEEEIHARRLRSEQKSAGFRAEALKKESEAVSRVGRALNGGSNAAGHGGHGGALAGMLTGNNRRMLGDGLDSVTGQRGWVMRLGGLETAMHLLGSGSRLMLGGGLAAAVGMAGMAAHEGWKTHAAEDESRDRARTGLSDVLRRTEFSSAGQGIASLSEQIDKTEEQGKAQGDALAQFRENTRGYHRSVFGTMGFQLRDSLAHLWGGQTNAEKIRESEQQEGVLTAREKVLRGRRSEAYSHEAAAAGERLDGSQFQAQRMESEMSEKGAIAEAQKSRASKEDLENIRRKFAIQREGIDLEEAAQTRAVSQQERETYIRGRGRDVAQNSAFARFSTADSAYQAAHGTEARAKAGAERGSAWQGYVEAERETNRRKDEQAIENGLAEFRGTAEQRTLQTAKAELAIAEKNRDYAKQAREEEARAAELVVAHKTRALELTRQQLAAAESGRAAAAATGRLATNSARYRLSQADALNTPDEGSQFGAGQAIEREQAAAQVKAATIERNRADSVVNEQLRGMDGVASAEAVAAQIKAQEELNRAKAEQEAIGRRLTFQEQERTHALSVQLGAAERTTATMRLQTSGRSDLAGLQQSRGDTEVEAAELDRKGLHKEADEKRAQQSERELQFADSKMLQPNGRRRRPSEVHREEREARRRAGRITRFNNRLRNHGVIEEGVHGGSLAGDGSAFSHAFEHRRGFIGPVLPDAFSSRFDRSAEDKASWKNQFARKDRQDPAGPSAVNHHESMASTLQQIQTTLDRRLPRN